MTVHCHPVEKKTGLSRSFPLKTLDPATIARTAWTAVDRDRSTAANGEEVPLSWYVI